MIKLFVCIFIEKNSNEKLQEKYDKQIKFWVDDIRVPPKDYFWTKTVYSAKWK